MTTKPSVIFVLITALSLPGHAWAADPVDAAPGDLGLGTLLEKAVDRAPDAALNDAYKAESRALNRRAGSWLGDAPSASVSASSDQPTDGDGAREYEAGVELPLPRMGESDAWSALSSAVKTQAGARFKALRWRLAGKVREAVWSLSLAESELDQAQQMLESARRLESDVSRRVEAGDLPDDALLLARQEVSSLSTEVEKARRSVSDATVRLEKLTGMGRLPSSPQETKSSQESVPSDHPLLRLASAQVKRAQQKREVTRIQGAGNNTLSLGARRNRGSRREDFGNEVFVGLKVPFGTASHQAPEQAKAERAYTENRVRQQRRLRELKRSRRESDARLATLQRELEHSKQSLELAESYYQSRRRAFELGEIDVMDLIRSRQRVAQARTLHERKRLQRGREIARYNQAVGEIPDES